MSRQVGAVQAGGWWWRRGDGGTVTIWAGPDEDGSEIEVTVEAAVWARIVAGMSAGGDSRRSYRQALALHEGNLP